MAAIGQQRMRLVQLAAVVLSAAALGYGWGAPATRVAYPPAAAPALLASQERQQLPQQDVRPLLAVNQGQLVVPTQQVPKRLQVQQGRHHRRLELLRLFPAGHYSPAAGLGLRVPGHHLHQWAAKTRGK